MYKLFYKNAINCKKKILTMNIKRSKNRIEKYKKLQSVANLRANAYFWHRKETTMLFGIFKQGKSGKITNYRIFVLFFLLLVSYAGTACAENGYQLWLRYSPIEEKNIKNKYASFLQNIVFPQTSETTRIALQELESGLAGMLGFSVPLSEKIDKEGTLLAGTFSKIQPIAGTFPEFFADSVGEEGYLILTKVINRKKCIIITAKKDIGVLYGVFHFLRLIQTRKDLSNLFVVSDPSLQLRVLNHWDNPNRTVERGYAGFSLWDWHKLPYYIDQRYIDYARANASIGINGTVLNNVNASILFLTPEYLRKVKALADVFRPYGIKVYLSVRFSAPVELGGLSTADPFDAGVQNWWKQKVSEIYELIPDFGGFLVKANSEGQPGPQNYGRNHADGANMLADVLAPFGGVVMWRAFVYSNISSEDRAKQAYNEFKPLDGKFRKNVLVQVKNGPIDFQPREPFHPLYGAMSNTSLMMEFQITQEYLGQGTHLVFLGKLFEEVLRSETYACGKGTTVADILRGKCGHQGLTGMAGVANTGTDINWCGHPFAQANWYAFGRFAWNPDIASETVAEEWLRMTFSNQPNFVEPVKKMMLSSYETAVQYMTPLGLHHIMGYSHHYGPAPWIKDAARFDWTSVYYHRADSIGIGFDRSPSGSNAVSQYHSPLREEWADPDRCPEKYLLWFHHIPWNKKLTSGRTLWEELCYRYCSGVNSVKQMQQIWDSAEQFVDEERFRAVKMLLNIQYQEAVWWHDACILYFQTFSKLPVPAFCPRPLYSLEYYQNLRFYYVPGN